MRRVVAILAAAVCLPVVAHAQEAYAAILLEYLTGDSDAAIARLASLPPGELDAGVAAFDTARSRLVLTGAAALHTELALGRGGGGTGDYHLHVATAIVREFRTRYLIAYSPRGVDAPGWHQIELKVKGRFAAVQARSGYQK